MANTADGPSFAYSAHTPAPYTIHTKIRVKQVHIRMFMAIPVLFYSTNCGWPY